MSEEVMSRICIIDKLDDIKSSLTSLEFEDLIQLEIDINVILAKYDIEQE